MKFVKLIVLVLILSACTGEPSVKPQNQAPQAQIRGVGAEIYVVSHGWHTGLVVPAGPIEGTLPFLKKALITTDYYEFGWGDFEFYQAETVTAGIALQAAMWPTDTVIQVVAVPGRPERYFIHSEIVKVTVSGQGLKALTQYIAQSFLYPKSGDPRPLKPALYGKGQFYPGTGQFHMFNTCNSWTAKGLVRAGVLEDDTDMVRAESVMELVRKVAIE